MSHELAHCLLHAPDQDPVARTRAEVEAESVAYVVCQAAGMATTTYGLPYLARWSGGAPFAAAERIEGAVSERLAGGVGRPVDDDA